MKAAGSRSEIAAYVGCAQVSEPAISENTKLSEKNSGKYKTQ